MKFKYRIHLILILVILILAGAAVGQTAASNTHFEEQDDLLQIKYIIKFIELSTEEQKSLNLINLLYDNSQKDGINFYNSEEVLELVDPEKLYNLKLNFAKEKNYNYRIIDPKLIVSPFERTSIEVTKEILNINDDKNLFYLENKLFLSILIKNISEDNKYITTEFNIESNNNNFLNTTVNLKSDTDNLIGILTINKLSEKNLNNKKNKNFIVYLKALPYQKQENNQIVDLKNINDLFDFQSLSDKEDKEESFVILYCGNLYFLQSKMVLNNDYSFYLSIKENKFLKFALDKNIIRTNLNLETKIYFEKEKNYFLSVGLNENVEISPFFTLGAGVYPLVYSLEYEKFMTGYYWAKTDLNLVNKKNTISLIYNFKNYHSLRVEIKRDFWKNIELILAQEFKNDLRIKDKWELGLKVKF